MGLFSLSMATSLREGKVEFKPVEDVRREMGSTLVYLPKARYMSSPLMTKLVMGPGREIVDRSRPTNLF